MLNSETRILEIHNQSIEELKALLKMLMTELLDEFHVEPEKKT